MTSRYTLSTKLGEGGFGEIHLAFDNVKGQNVAMKLERKVKTDDADALKKLLDAAEAVEIPVEKPTQLEHEYNLYKQMGPIEGIPVIYAFDKTSDPHNSYMVMQLLGANLENLFDANHRKFHTRTILQITFGVLNILKWVHSRGIIHKDIKPENIMTVTERGKTRLYLADFGLASMYTTENGAHIEWKQRNASLDGTARYASVNAHMGLAQSRRDDIESLLYMAVYLTKGKLPWQGIKGKDKQERVGRIKLETTEEELCSGMHACYIAFLRHARNLRFDQEPDYEHLRRLLYEAAVETSSRKKGLSADPCTYEWDKIVRPMHTRPH